MSHEPLLYFAYGSNMSSHRLQRRTPSARSLRAASLAGYRLVFHKRGMDGSGKCAILRTGSQADVVHGVIFQLHHAEKTALTAAEALGYEERAVYVRTTAQWLHVFTYVAVVSHLEPSLKPYEWYKAFVVHGATEHDLPTGYVERLERVQAIRDPQPTRAMHHRRILESG